MKQVYDALVRAVCNWCPCISPYHDIMSFHLVNRVCTIVLYHTFKAPCLFCSIFVHCCLATYYSVVINILMMNDQYFSVSQSSHFNPVRKTSKEKG